LEASWFRELAFRFLRLGHARRFAWSVCSLLGFWLLGKRMERGSQRSKGAWQLWRPFWPSDVHPGNEDEGTQQWKDGHDFCTWDLRCRNGDWQRCHPAVWSSGYWPWSLSLIWKQLHWQDILPVRSVAGCDAQSFPAFAADRRKRTTWFLRSIGDYQSG